MWVRMHVCMRALSLPLNTEPELTGSNRLLASAEANFFEPISLLYPSLPSASV